MDKRAMTYFCNHILRTTQRRVKGTIAEKMVETILNECGYHASRQPEKCKGDLWVRDIAGGENFRIEVKVATRNTQGKYTFGLKKHDKFGMTDCGYSDFVILVAVTISGAPVFFVVPSDALNQQSVSICGNPHEYNGKLHKFRQYHNSIILRKTASENNPVIATLADKMYSQNAAMQ